MKKLNWIYNNKDLKERLEKNLKQLLRLLYGESSGSTGNASTTGAEGTPSEGGFESAPPAGDVEPPSAEPPAAEITPESKKANMNILLEQNFDKHSRFLNLSQGQDSLGEISKELDKLLNS
jgi:hypothetical protein